MPLPKKNKKSNAPRPPPPIRAKDTPLSVSSFSMRPARPSDQPSILELAGVLFPNATPVFGDNDWYYVATSRGRLAGWVHLHSRQRSVYLQGLAVHPHFRRRGIGQALLRLALTVAARRHPGQSVALKVKSSNAGALALYLKEGFMLRATAGASYVLMRAPPN